MAIMSYKDALMLSIFQRDVYSSYIIFLRILWQVEDPMHYLEILENHFNDEEKKTYKYFFNEILNSFNILNKKNKPDIISKEINLKNKKLNFKNKDAFI